MPNYINGKIYQLIFGDLTERYIGSTTQPLRKRLFGHKSSSASQNVRDLVSEVGKENVKIRLIEAYPCSCKDALLAREQHWIDKRKPYVNIKRAISVVKQEVEGGKFNGGADYLKLQFDKWRITINSPHETPSIAERDEFKSILRGEDYKENCKQQFNKRWNDHGCVEIDDTGELEHRCRNWKTCPRNPLNMDQ